MKEQKIKLTRIGDYYVDLQKITHIQRDVLFSNGGLVYFGSGSMPISSRDFTQLLKYFEFKEL